MKVVMVKGSPHKNGSSNMLASQFAKGCQEAGHTVVEMDVAHMKIHPCLGCGYCRKNGTNCVQKDDVPEVMDQIISADMVVFVTPIYYFGITAQLKMLIDRFYSYNEKLKSKHMKAVLIVAAMDCKEEGLKALSDHYLKICKYLNFTDCGQILGTKCGSLEATRDSPHMEQAYQLGKSI